MATAARHVFASTPRALVVDDSQIARFVLKDLLQRHGFEVDTADSAETGLEKVAADLPDIVFMDHLLPGMTGLEAVRRLRSDWSADGLPIVMYTSQEGEDFARHATVAGANGIYLKTSEGDALTPLLVRLGLIDAPEPVQAIEPNVVPLRADTFPAEASTRIDAASDEERLVALLEPILEKHRAQLQQDLLAEFAILERYEERMRRELVAQIDTTTRRAIASALGPVQHNAVKRPALRPRSGKAYLRVAAFLLALAAGLALGITSQIKDFRGAEATAAIAESTPEPETMALSDH